MHEIQITIDSMHQTVAARILRKVVAQESSIVCHMERAGILKPWAIYVELGAGSGGLSRC
jgi:hypothetical protein